jgi:hypothetical protein
MGKAKRAPASAQQRERKADSHQRDERDFPTDESSVGGKEKSIPPKNNVKEN